MFMSLFHFVEKPQPRPNSLLSGDNKWVSFIKNKCIFVSSLIGQSLVGQYPEPVNSSIW